jgi:hypothetical protein
MTPEKPSSGPQDAPGRSIPIETPNRLTVKLEIDPTPLQDRQCGRCNSTDFRALVFQPSTYFRQCADCSYHVGAAPVPGCGRVVAFTIRENCEEVYRCGDLAVSEFGDPTAQSTRALAICLGCHKIVDLM